MTREQQARLLLAKGYSCEQAIFGAFADALGMSTVGAMLMAPSRKERGTVCGAYRAGVLLISLLTNPKPSGKKRSKKRVQRTDEKQEAKRRERTHAVQAKFTALFISKLGTLDCAEIKRKRETGWSGMDDVIGITARLVDQALDKAKEKP